MQGVVKPPAGWAIKHSRRNGWRFADGFIQRVFFSDVSSVKNQMRIQSVLHCVDMMLLDKPSIKQVTKAKDAILRPLSKDEVTCVTWYEDAFQVKHDRDEAIYHDLEFRSLPQFLGGKKRSPTLEVDWKGRFKAFRSISREDPCSASFSDYILHDRGMRRLQTEHPEEFARALVGRKIDPRVLSAQASQMYDYPAGKVVILQEGACKARWVANPSLHLQALGESLKVRLDMYISRNYPEIRTRDQDSGRADVVRWLSEGKTVHSIDLSSFTDRFPLGYQLSVLRQLVLRGIVTQFDYDVFDDVSKRSWIAPDLGGEVKWAAGQPLGFGPSFHLATLTHAVILDYLKRLSRDEPGDFRIVGDDVVIYGEEFAKAYRDLMHKSGVQISPSKGMVSSKYAEFLGKIILEKGVTPSIKVKFLTEQSQLTKVLQHYGRSALRFLSPREKRWSAVCFLPTHLKGGLGWGISGMTYQQYLSCLKQDRLVEEVVLNELSDLYKVRSGGLSMEAHVRRLVEFYDQNLTNLSPSEWRVVSGADVTIDEFSCVPTQNLGVPDTAHPVVPQNCFTSIVDTIHRTALAGGTEAATKTSDSLRAMLTEHGYINPNEKPVNPGQSSGDSNEHKSTGLIAPDRYFNKEGTDAIIRGEIQGEAEEPLDEEDDHGYDYPSM